MAQFKIKNRKQFSLKYPSIYVWLLKNNNELLEKYFPYRRKLVWTYDECVAEALKHKTSSSWSAASGSSYMRASRMGWLSACTAHMTKLRHTISLLEIKKEAKKYKSRWQFQQFSRKAYRAARKFNVLDEVCRHMRQAPKSLNLSEALSLAKSKRHMSIAEFGKKYVTAYKILRKHRAQTKYLKSRRNVYSAKTALDLAKSCKNYSDFCKKNSKLMQYIRRNPELLNKIKNLLNFKKPGKPVINTKKLVFISIGRAARAFSGSTGNLHVALRKGTVFKGLSWRYATEAEVELAKKEGRYYE